jgi:hypothetical protein
VVTSRNIQNVFPAPVLNKTDYFNGMILFFTSFKHSGWIILSCEFKCSYRKYQEELNRENHIYQSTCLIMFISGNFGHD